MIANSLLDTHHNPKGPFLNQCYKNKQYFFFNENHNDSRITTLLLFL